MADAERILAAEGRAARMGGGTGAPGRWHSAESRGDTQCWVTPELLRAHGCRALAHAVGALTGPALRSTLADRGFDVSGGTSVQLACYPGGGARYRRHRDASASCPGRSVTAL